MTVVVQKPPFHRDKLGGGRHIATSRASDATKSLKEVTVEFRKEDLKDKPWTVVQVTSRDGSLKGAKDWRTIDARVFLIRPKVWLLSRAAERFGWETRAYSTT